MVTIMVLHASYQIISIHIWPSIIQLIVQDGNAICVDLRIIGFKSRLHGVQM